MLRQLEKSLCRVENVAWLTAHNICPALRMAPQQPPYHTKNVKTSSIPWFPISSQKMGIVRNAAITVVFGSAKYCGSGLDHLATVQNFSRLQYIIGHIRSKNITSKRIRQQIDYTQLEIGFSTQVLGQDYKRYRHAILCSNWITEIWESLHACKASVYIKSEWIPHPERLGDIPIMETLTSSTRVKHSNPSAINICRIYLRVFFIYDIVNIRGDKMEEWEING
jgi:hypothetical protein